MGVVSGRDAAVGGGGRPGGEVGEWRHWYPSGQLGPAQGDPGLSADAAFELGAEERAAGDVDAARSAFQRAVDTGDPETGPKALANLAVLEASAGRVAQARAAFEQAIATGHPDHAPKSQFNFAIFEQRNGELTHAHELYEQAVTSGHPEHARKALFNLANLKVQQGRVSEACGLFLRAMAPPFLGDTAQRAHRRLIEVDSGRLAEACEVYVRAIADEDERTAARARSLLHDLDPQYGQAERTICVGNRTFNVADIESAEWAMGRPRYGSGYVDVYTRDGKLHTVYVDLGDRYDRQGYDALLELLGLDQL